MVERELKEMFNVSRTLKRLGNKHLSDDVRLMASACLDDYIQYKITVIRGEGKEEKNEDEN